MNPTTTLLAAGSLLVAACGRGPELATNDAPASSRGVPGVSVLRIPREGGVARLYRVPALDSAAWKPADKLPPVERPLGADPEQGLAFVLDRKNNVVALDLDTRRVRTYLENIRYATLGPDGALYAVDTASSVVQLVRRTPVRFRSKLQGKPTQLHGTMEGALVARLGGDRPALEYLGSDQAPTSIPLPQGQVAASFLGDLVAVAADTAVVLYAAQRRTEPRTIPISGDARAVIFSPSGHRIYVARAAAPLLVLDRFDGTQLREVELPGPARDLRGDIYGRWLLVRPEQGDSLWVIDVGTGKYTGAVAARWTDDLPVVAPPNTLLLRRGPDLVALDLSAPGFTEVGRIPGGASDFWLPIAWQPAQDTELPFAADSAALAAADTGPARPNVYLQVSSSQNPAWANELSAKLGAAGLPASVLSPRRAGELYRVVLGPYATREQAEATGRKIGMPSFVVTAQDQSTAQ
ncbi:MAG TPA: SPOR domain-containing protein [Gemmatimonadales bacterium]|nr:SPOR domain-containing protein [Gemmatimonadales bacterium]